MNRTTQKTVEQERAEQNKAVELSITRKLTTTHHEQQPLTEEEAPRAGAGMSPIGAILAARAGPERSRSKPRPETLEEDYQRVQDCVADRGASLKSSTTRAWRL
jgi:hypothetical protein